MSWVLWRDAEKTKMGVWVAVRGRHFGLERGPRSSIWAMGAVRGRQVGSGARSAVVNLGLGRGPRSWIRARSAVSRSRGQAPPVTPLGALQLLIGELGYVYP